MPESKGKSSKTIHRLIAKWSRWVHIYLSLLSLAAILFFSITGFTLNHPDWFFAESTQVTEGAVRQEWLHLNQPPPENWDENDYGHQIDRLSIVEFLRSEHHLAGRMTEFLSFQDECEVTFQGPGYAATARIDRSSGAYSLSVTCNDLISIMNDLHKGRNTGPVWSAVIDVSAIISTIVAMSGFLLIFYLRLNRTLRILSAIGGAILLIGFCWGAMS